MKTVIINDKTYSVPDHYVDANKIDEFISLVDNDAVNKIHKIESTTGK